VAEHAGDFVRSSFCAIDKCVEVAPIGSHGVAVRGQSRDHVLYFTADEWRDFVLGVKAGEFDVD